MLRVATVLAVLALAGCGSEARQDADEPEGTFRIEVVDASFPKRQQIAEPVEFKVSVRNADDETLRNVAVTVQTEPQGINAPIAFGQRSLDEGLSDSGRPIWVLDEGPLGGDVANVNTWSAGTLRAGETRELTWKLVAARAGRFTIGYRVSPGLTGRAQPPEARPAARSRSGSPTGPSPRGSVPAAESFVARSQEPRSPPAPSAGCAGRSTASPRSPADGHRSPS